MKKYGYYNGISKRPQSITAWRPSDVNKNQIAPPYPYVEDATKSDANLNIINPKFDKDKEVSSKRFSSSVGKRNGNFNQFTNFQSDPYDRAREKERVILFL